jgi:hypothetical protein
MVVMVNRFERDSEARDACIAHDGSHCSVCDMSFLDRYGETMKDFIHIHHLVPLSTTGVRYQVDPIADLHPVCPNCHAVIHREDPPLSILEARKLLSEQRRPDAFRARANVDIICQPHEARLAHSATASANSNGLRTRRSLGIKEVYDGVYLPRLILVSRMAQDYIEREDWQLPCQPLQPDFSLRKSQRRLIRNRPVQ